MTNTETINSLRDKANAAHDTKQEEWDKLDATLEVTPWLPEAAYKPWTDAVVAADKAQSEFEEERG